MLRCAPPGHERWFTRNAEVFNNLQRFEWYHIFNMSGALLAEVKRTGVQAKRCTESEVLEHQEQVKARIASRRSKASSSTSQ